MNEGSNGQVCQMCHDRVARTEALCYRIYLCDRCATLPIDSRFSQVNNNDSRKQCTQHPIQLGKIIQ